MSNYLSLPGAAGSYASVPDTNLLDADTAHGVQSRGLWQTNAGPTNPAVVADSDAWGGYAIEQAPTAFGEWLKMDAATTCPQVSGSTEYTIGAQVKGINLKAGRTVYVYVVWLDSGLSIVGQDTGTAVELVEGQYVDMSVTGTTPATAAYARIRFSQGAPGNFDGSETLRLGSAILRTGSDSTFVPSLRIVGDLEYETDLTLDEWGWDGAARTFASIDGATAARPWYLLSTYSAVEGQLSFQIQLGGGAETPKSSVAPSLASGARGKVKVTRDATTGDVKFYIDDVQLGTTQSSTAGPIVYDGSSLQIGIRNSGATDPMAAGFFSGVLRDGIGGPVVARTDFTNVTPSELAAASFTSDEGHTVTLSGDEWAYVRPVTSGILSRAELLLEADDGNEGNSPKWADRSGNDHHAQLGSAAGADTNDPEWLPHSGENYVRLPGAAGNYVSSADVNLLDADTAHVYQDDDTWANNANTSGLTRADDPTAPFADSSLQWASAADNSSSILQTFASRPTVSSATQYTISVYVWSDVACDWRLDMTQDVGGTQAGSNVSVPANTWTQLTTTKTTGASTTAAGGLVRADVGNVSSAGSSFRVSAACLRAGSDGTFVPSLRIVGDLDLRAKVAAAVWDTASDQYLLSTRSGNDGYGLYIVANSKAVGVRHGTGSDSRPNSDAGATLVDGQATELRVTFDTDSGAVIYYQDGTQFGTDTDPSTGAASPSGVDEIAGAAVGGVSGLFDGDIYWAEVRDGIDGPVVARYDAEDAAEPFATQTDAVSGRTWTYARSGSGLYVVDRPAFGLHTDDYMVVADHADLDFALAESLTLIVASRALVWKSGSNAVIVGKGTATSSAGYRIYAHASAEPYARIHDGSNSTIDILPAGVVDRTAAVLALRRSVALDQVEGFLDGAGSGSPTTDASTGTLANAVAFVVGGNGGGGEFFDGEIMAVALFREALTDDEIAAAGAALLGGSVGRMLLLGVG